MFECDGSCPGNELGDCYGQEWHQLREQKYLEQKFTRKQVERIIDLVNNDRKPPSEFVAECIDQVAEEG